MTIPLGLCTSFSKWLFCVGRPWILKVPGELCLTMYLAGLSKIQISPFISYFLGQLRHMFHECVTAVMLSSPWTFISAPGIPPYIVQIQLKPPVFREDPVTAQQISLTQNCFWYSRLIVLVLKFVPLHPDHCPKDWSKHSTCLHPSNTWWWHCIFTSLSLSTHSLYSYWVPTLLYLNALVFPVSKPSLYEYTGPLLIVWFCNTELFQ